MTLLFFENLYFNGILSYVFILGRGKYKEVIRQVLKKNLDKLFVRSLYKLSHFLVYN